MRINMISVVYEGKIMFQGVAFTRHDVLAQASSWINSRTDINSEVTTAETVEKFFLNWDYIFEIKEVDLKRWPKSYSRADDVSAACGEVVEAKRDVVAEAKAISEHAYNAEVNARKEIIMNALSAGNALDALRRLSEPKMGHTSNELEQIVRNACKRLFGQVEEADKEREYFNAAMDALVVEGAIVTAGLRLTPVSCKVGPKEHLWIKVVPSEINIRQWCSDNFGTYQSSWELKEIYPCFSKPKNVTIILTPLDIANGWKLVWRY